MANLSRLIRFHALRTPGRVALSHAGVRLDYAAAWAGVEVAAALLAARGVAPGERVALLMRNSTALVQIACAVSHVGGVLVPINFRLATAEIDHILRDSGAVLLCADEDYVEVTRAIPVLTVPAAALADARRLGSVDRPVRMSPRAPSDLFRIMYTSGTTDHPKGVMHSYANFYAKSADHIAVLGLTAASRLLVVGPLYHVGAFDLPGVAVLWAGGMLAIQREFDAAAALDLIASEELTCAWAAPVMAGALIEAQHAAPRDARSLKWVIGGGERTPESRIRAFAAAFPAARYIDAYGLTESCGGDTLMEPGREIEKIGSVGRPVPQLDVSIRDEAGEALPAGTAGEVCLRGPKVTAGYWNAADKTRASFRGDWFRTGDIGYLDAEGFLFLTDRAKDIIISGGENIASSEVERVIGELAAVRDVAVVAMPDARWGERPAAFVVARTAGSVGEAEVRAHCRARLAAFKVPDRIIFTESLPRNASGKVLKNDLRSRLIGAIA